MSELRLQMEESEILQDYKYATKKSEQVKILAQLNCVSNKEMALWLRDHGCEVDGRYFHDQPKKPKVEEADTKLDGSENEVVEEMINAVPVPYIVPTPAPEPAAAELLTRDEAFAVACHIDSTLIDYIRNNADVDNMRWLCGMASAYRKLCKYSGYVGLTEREENDE